MLEHFTANYSFKIVQRMIIFLIKILIILNYILSN